MKNQAGYYPSMKELEEQTRRKKEQRAREEKKSPAPNKERFFSKEELQKMYPSPRYPKKNLRMVVPGHLLKEGEKEMRGIPVSAKELEEQPRRKNRRKVE